MESITDADYIHVKRVEINPEIDEINPAYFLST